MKRETDRLPLEKTEPAWFLRLFEPPLFDDPEQNRTAQLLNLILWWIGLILVVTTFSDLLLAPEALLATVLFSLPFYLTIWVCYQLLHSGQVYLSSVIFIVVLWGLITAVTYFFGGLINTSMIAYLPLVVLSALLISEWAGVVVALLSIGAGIAFYGLEQWGLLPPGLSVATSAQWLITLSLYLLVIASLLFLSIRQLRQALFELNQSNEAMHRFQETLEQRVADRTYAVQISATLGREISLVRDQNTLVTMIVQKVQAAFGYNRVQLYLLVPGGDRLRRVSTTSNTAAPEGTLPLELTLGEGDIGSAALQKRPILLPPQAAELEPEEMTEAAIPLLAGNELMGVMTVSHRQPQQITKQDVDWLQIVAAQVAGSLQTIRLYSEMQVRLEQEALLNHIGQRMQQAESIDELLQIAARELGERLPVNQVDLAVHLDKMTRSGGEK